MKISSLAKEFSVPVLCLSAALGLILFIVNRDSPKVGHDYGFFIPRLLDTHLHHKVNGLAVQWYTANFGAGTPAYPNPQYLQYSLPQFLMFVVNPWRALLLSLAIYSAIGFACFYLFMREEMGWISTACALGAMFILANGFFVEHAIVGHVGFQQFPLLGAILFLVFTKKLGFLPAGVLTGLVVAAIVNQAGFVILVIFAYSLLILLPLLYLMKPEIFTGKMFATLLTGGLFAALLSISKVSAVAAFMRFFPRLIEDHYGQSYLQGMAGIVRQLTAFNFIIPSYLFTGRNINETTLFFQQGSGAQYGPWESNIFLSPALLFLLAFGLGYFLFAVPRTRPGISIGKAIAILILALAIWLVMDLTLAQGWLYSLIKPLPILRSLHANLRFTSAFIFPLALLGALTFHRVFRDRRVGSQVAFLLLSISTIGILCLYLMIPDEFHNRNFNLRSALPVYAKIDAGWNFSLQNLAEINDMEVFHQENSNLSSQDPMFGYEGEYFQPKATVGPIMEVNNGFYNLTNPAGYVFPEENGLQPFELFRADQKATLELFVNHRQPALEISSWQKLADAISLVTWIGSVLYLLFMLAKRGTGYGR